MTTLEAVRDELLERRERLASLAVTVRESQLVELLRQVDGPRRRRTKRSTASAGPPPSCAG